MAAKATVATQSPVLKRLYPKGVESTIYQASRMFERCKKNTNFTNEDMAVVVRDHGTSGGAARFADALASMGESRKARFIVNRKREYQLWSVDGEAIAATNGDPAAIVNLVKDESKEALYKFGVAMGRNITGAGGGSLSTIHADTTLSSTTLQFAYPEDTQFVEIGDWLQFATADGTSASADPAVDLEGSGAALQIVSLNREAGTAVMSAAINTVTGVALGDNIFRRGDYAAKMTGIEGWLPFSTPTSTPFLGVDRTAYDLARVSGFRYTGGGGSYGATIIKAGARAHTHGIATLNALYMSSIDFGEFVNELGQDRLRTAEDSKVGYKYVEVHSACAAGGVLKVIAEPKLRQGYGWAINDELLECATAGPCPSPLAHGTGNKGMQVPYNDDALQGRLGCYGNIIYRNPGEALIINFG